jgi:hypothetical protein
MEGVSAHRVSSTPMPKLSIIPAGIELFCRGRTSALMSREYRLKERLVPLRSYYD